jgi:hypothetical protein
MGFLFMFLFMFLHFQPTCVLGEVRFCKHHIDWFYTFYSFSHTMFLFRQFTHLDSK